MGKVYFAKLNSDKTMLKIEEREAEIGSGTIKFTDGGFTHILFHSADGKPRQNFGIGLTPEQAVQSFREGKKKEARALEEKAQELYRLSELGVEGKE